MLPTSSACVAGDPKNALEYRRLGWESPDDRGERSAACSCPASDGRCGCHRRDTSLSPIQAKVAEENRLAVANRAELDVRLLTLFTELMGKAHARGLSILSESTVSKIIEQQGSLSPSSLSELKELLEACTVVYPVGTAEQDATIAAIAELGGKYELLRFPAERALETIRNFKPATADNALNRLRRSEATRQ